MAANRTLPAGAKQQEIFDGLFQNLRSSLIGGLDKPAVPFTIAAVLGEDGIKLLKESLENVFAANFQMDVDLIANTVTALPIGPLSPSSTLSAPSFKGGEKLDSKTAKQKVPRPPNAFIIYRKEWHPRVVAENPGLRNNAISVIIGKKWKGESQAVKDEYKRKANMAKEQHAATNPGYQYQPRKPSEKKKRMTKSKLAKLAVTAAGQQDKVPGYVEPYQALAPTLDFTEQLGYATFTSGPMTDGLTVEMDGWNDVAATFPEANFVASEAVPLANGGVAAEAQQFEFDDMAPYHDCTLPYPALSSAAMDDPVTFDPFAEIDRQANLFDEFDFNDFINSEQLQ